MLHFLNNGKNSNKHPISFKPPHPISTQVKPEKLNKHPYAREEAHIQNTWCYLEVLVGYLKVIWCYLVLFGVI